MPLKLVIVTHEMFVLKNSHNWALCDAASFKDCVDFSSRVHRVDETVGNNNVDHDEADSHDIDGGTFIKGSG